MPATTRMRRCTVLASGRRSARGPAGGTKTWQFERSNKADLAVAGWNRHHSKDAFGRDRQMRWITASSRPPLKAKAQLPQRPGAGRARQPEGTIVPILDVMGPTNKAPTVRNHANGGSYSSRRKRRAPRQPGRSLDSRMRRALEPPKLFRRGHDGCYFRRPQRTFLDRRFKAQRRARNVRFRGEQISLFLFFLAILIGRRRRGASSGGGLFAIFTPPPPGSPERDPTYGALFTEKRPRSCRAQASRAGHAQAYTHAVIDTPIKTGQRISAGR